MNATATSETLSAPPRGVQRVLVVDDEPGVIALASAILSTAGYMVGTVSDGRDVLHVIAGAEAEGDPVHLVILDLTLPGGPSGFEILEAIRDRFPMLPVMACSGYFQEGARELCKSLGFNEILKKPYTADGMLTTVRRTLRTPGDATSSPAP